MGLRLVQILMTLNIHNIGPLFWGLVCVWEVNEDWPKLSAATR